MDAMDWPALLRGALWIAGLSLSLASFSHLRWAAKHANVSLRMAVSWDSFLAPFFVGLTLFAAGMAWGARSAWEIMAWAVIGVVFAAQALWSFRNMRRGATGKERSHETS